MTVDLTKKEIFVLLQCIRIASEDESVSTYDPSGRLVKSLERKLSAPSVSRPELGGEK